MKENQYLGIFNIDYGNKVWYLYGASSNEHRNLMPNYLLQWEGIKYAISKGKDIYDFRGVSGILDENHPQYGLYRFKKGFDAEFTEFIGEIYINCKPLVYSAYKISEKIFKKSRGINRDFIQFIKNISNTLKSAARKTRSLLKNSFKKQEN